MRSAFAAELARHAFPELAARIVGGGTHAVSGRAAQDSALRVGAELGTALDRHAATAIATLELTRQDVVVCMDAQNEANVLATYPAFAARVFRVGDICATNETFSLAQALPDRELRDPYGLGDMRTREAFQLLQPLVLQWGSRLL